MTASEASNPTRMQRVLPLLLPATKPERLETLDAPTHGADVPVFL